jgi:putative copper resistance protein D
MPSPTAPGDHAITGSPVIGSGTRRAAGLLLLTALAPGVALGLLFLSDGLAATSLPGLPDSGSVTRWGLPVVQAVRDASATVAVGVVVLAATCLPTAPGPSAGSGGGSRRVSSTQRLLLKVGAVTAMAWAWSTMAMLIFVYADASGEPVGGEGFWSQAWYFATSFDPGRYLLTGAALAALLATACLMIRRPEGMGFAALVALAGVWPMALGGHATGSLDHNRLVELQLFHLLGVTVWTGGLVGLLVVRRHLGENLGPVVRRYSRLAGWCLLLVALSGISGAALRLPGASALTTSYGAMLAVKVAVLSAVAALGWWQRTRIVRRIESGASSAFARLAFYEVVLLLTGAGAGVALSRTNPPAPETDPSLSNAQALLGTDLPPELGIGEWFTQWKPDLIWLTVALAMTAWYLSAVLRLRARGDGWPLLRTIAWLLGWLLVVWATSGSPGVYGRVLFSMHMVQHMTIATAAPTFLVLGAPITLALRALPRRTDGSLGPREWLQEALRSFLAHLLTLPVVTAGMFVVSLAVFYYSGLFELSLESHTMHVAMVAHFLLTGFLLANCLVGIDPGIHRPMFPLRVVLLMVTFGFHALFSVSLMSSDQVLAPDWFSALQRPWGASLLDDQQFGASLGWALGDYPLAILAGALIVRWVASDRRERRRFDRSEARTGGQVMADYNAYLSRLGKLDGSLEPSRDPAPPPAPESTGERQE